MDPLNPSRRDPLLPKTDQPSTPQQEQNLQRVIEELQNQAQAAQAAGNLDAAFGLWYRELRLRQSLDLGSEIEALARVGKVAWQTNRPEDLQIITRRLETIGARENLSVEELKALAQAYEKLQLPQLAAQTYRRFLEQNRANLDPQAQQALLKKIGELYLAGFRYEEAALAYEEFLAQIQSSQPTLETTQAWQQLVYIYEQSQQLEKALQAKQQLLAIYEQQQQQGKIAPLKIAIAQDYETLNQPETASQYYQEAFNTAWELQQFNDAEEALESLGELYYRYRELNYALQVYKELLKVQQQSYNYYGLMTTYDCIGKILGQQGDLQQALVVYEKALEVASSLNYRENYFRRLVESLQP
jgi:tetratricopeptide (TPR) repeat protein